MVGVKFLRSYALFGGIANEDLKRIRTRLKKEHFSKGEFIVREGEQGDRLYFLREGSVEILKKVHGPSGVVQVRLAVFGKGDTFCEMEMLDEQPRSASVRALDDVSALSLTNQGMYEIHKTNRDAFTMIVLNIAREVSRRLRRMDELVGSALIPVTGEKAAKNNRAGPSS